MGRWAWGLAIVAFMGMAQPIAAQEARQVLEEFASAVEDDELQATERLFSPGGVRLVLGEGSYQGNTPRRALAALERVLPTSDDASVSVRLTSRGDPGSDRAFGELTWLGTVTSTGERLRITIFVGLTHREEGWRIDELRTVDNSQ